MIHGVMILNKPRGWTSHDAVAKIRGLFHQQAVGHAGTLDPNATGVLLLCLGKATKLSRYFMQLEKEYHGFFLFGVSTDSQDADGNVIAERDASGVTEERIRKALGAYRGDILQVPPMVSAVKVNGKRLYRLARKGETVKREPRKIHVKTFELLHFDPPMAEVRIVCSKGTYVRTLAADLGEELGCGAHLHKLCRAAIGDYTVDDAVSMDELIDAAEEGTADRFVVPLSSAVDSLKEGVLRSGVDGRWSVPALPRSLALLEEIDPLPRDGEFLRIIDPSGKPVGVVEVSGSEGRLRKVFTVGR